jgi:hypothetical protein
LKSFVVIIINRRRKMGTRADFYIGRTPEAEWIGSVAWDGYPGGINEAILKATTEEEFRKAVESYFEPRDDVTRPLDGWPWPWETSSTTDYAYAFDTDKVFISNFGSPWHTTSQPYPNEDDYPNDDDWERAAAEWEAEGQPTDFPNMGKGMSAAPGSKRSGVIVFRG